MKTKQGDWVEIVYVGRLDDGSIFDLNDKELAKNVGMGNQHIHGQTVICLGQRDVVEGLDEALVDQDLGTPTVVIVQPEKGFGKRDAQKFSMVPLNKFHEQKINPVPGLRVNFDDLVGTVKSVSGGRVLVDFNHPLAGRPLHYQVTVKRKVDDVKEKVAGFLEMHFHAHGAKVSEKEGAVTVTLSVPKELQPLIEGEVRKRIAEVKSLTFEEEKKTSTK